MKKVFISAVLAIMMAVGMVAPVLAAPPEMEDWEIAYMHRDGNTATVYFTINPVNLQVESFTIVNNLVEKSVMAFVKYDGFTDEHIIFSFTAAPGETITEPISGLKLHRVPLNDPDDPDSVRYPNKTVIGVRSW